MIILSCCLGFYCSDGGQPFVGPSSTTPLRRAGPIPSLNKDSLLLSASFSSWPTRDSTVPPIVSTFCSVKFLVWFKQISALQILTGDVAVELHFSSLCSGQSVSRGGLRWIRLVPNRGRPPPSALATSWNAPSRAPSDNMRPVRGVEVRQSQTRPGHLYGAVHPDFASRAGSIPPLRQCIMTS